jgi:hypothetical protein
MSKSKKPRNISELIRELCDGDNPHRDRHSITIEQALQMTETETPSESQTHLKKQTV